MAPRPLVMGRAPICAWINTETHHQYTMCVFIFTTHGVFEWAGARSCTWRGRLLSERCIILCALKWLRFQWAVDYVLGCLLSDDQQRWAVYWSSFMLCLQLDLIALPQTLVSDVVAWACVTVPPLGLWEKMMWVAPDRIDALHLQACGRLSALFLEVILGGNGI